MIGVASAQVQLETVRTGLSSPVDIVHAGDDRLFIVERAGRIRILHPDGSLDPVPFLDITDRVLSAGGEQGLLGLAFHPHYATNGRFFVFYTTGTNNGFIRLSPFAFQRQCRSRCGERGTGNRVVGSGQTVPEPQRW